MSSNMRATRSRYSSPAHPHAGGGGGGGAAAASLPLESSKMSGNDASRFFMQRWLEPSVQTKASFEEAGLMRHGVLEGMAPLGTLPKVKKTESGGGGVGAGGGGGGSNNNNGGGGGVRRITLKIVNRNGATSSSAESNAEKRTTATTGNAATGNAAAASSRKSAESLGEARTMLPSLSTASSSSRRSLPCKGTAKKNDDDEDYNPKGSQRKKSARRAQASADKAQQAATVDGEEAAARGSSAQGNHTSALSPGLKHYPTAWALRTLYDEESEDVAFDSMVTDVLQQTADDDTLDEFSKQIGEKKREGKPDNDDCYYFAPPVATTATATATTTAAKNSRLQRGNPAQYGDLVGDSEEDEEELEEPEELPADDMVAGEGEGEGERRAAKKAKTSHSSSSSSGVLGVASSGGIADELRRRGSAMAQHNHLFPNHGKQNAAETQPSRKRRRRNSATSESSLSSAMTVPSPEARSKIGAVSANGASSAGAGAGSGGTTTATSSMGATSSGPGPQTQIQTKKQQPRPSRQSKHSSSQTKPRAQASRDNSKVSRPVTTLPTLAATAAVSKSSAASSEPNSPSPASPTTSIHSSSRATTTLPSSMPGRLAASSESLSQLPRSKSKTAKSAGSLPNSDAAMPNKAAAQQGEEGGGDEEELDAAWNRRRDAQAVTNNYKATESSVRIRSQQRATTPVASTRRTRRSLANAPPPTSRTTRSATKRPNDHVEGTLSPIPLSLTGDDASTVASRAVTPTGQRQAKRPKGLRVKSSPVKKSGGPAGGLPRLASESQSSFRAGTPKDPATDNDEFCSACGNAGDVLCCDGCPRSFHFECVNLAQSEDLPDEWYCNECIVRKFPSRVPIHKGAFASALNNLEKHIPRAFSLPKRLQNRFEGVKAGADGDYEEVSSKTAKRRPGFEEMPDLFKQRDENQAVLCHACQKPSSDARAIIPCSLCPFYWHLDCLDPPLAMPPVLKSWRCPIHVDDVLAEAPRLAPAHRFRKIKNTQPIAPIFTRGLRNNGHIEIDWSDEPEPVKNSGWPDPQSFGRTYKVSANGVILDFIEQLRKQGAGYGTRQNEQKWVPYPSPAPQLDESAHPGPLLGSALGRRVDEMQASLTLLGLKQKQSDGIDQLTSALLSGADENVLRLMARGNADNIALGQLTDNDKLSLRAMLAQMDAMSARIRQVLGDEHDDHDHHDHGKPHVSSMPTPDPTASTPPPSSLPLPAAAAAAGEELVQQATGQRMSSPIAPKKEEDEETMPLPSTTAMPGMPEPTPPLTMDLD